MDMLGGLYAVVVLPTCTSRGHVSAVIPLASPSTEWGLERMLRMIGWHEQEGKGRKNLQSLNGGFTPERKALAWH